jgi:hypothetical protein
MELDSSRMSFPYTRSSGDAASHRRARYREPEFLADRAHDFEDSSDEIYFMQRRGLPPSPISDHRTDRNEMGVEDFELERAQSPGKTIRNEPLLFPTGRTRRTADEADLGFHESDAEIIEKQLARYRDVENPADVAVEAAGAEPEDLQQRFDSQKLYQSPGAVSTEDRLAAALHEPETSMKKAGDRTVESSPPHATATEPDSSPRASV